MNKPTRKKRRISLLRWFLVALGMVVFFLATGMAALWVALGRPKVNTETPNAEQIALCRELFLLNPELEIEPLGYFRLDSLDVSHGFKFAAKPNDPVELLDEPHRARVSFSKNSENIFLSRGNRISWWDRPPGDVFGGDFLEASDSFIWSVSMGYHPNGDGTLTVWCYAESGANYDEADVVTSERLEFRGHHYQFVAEKEWLSWESAVARCEAMGGHLVVINDPEENDFLTQRLGVGKLPCFLGAHVKNESDAWKWVDGSPLSYQNWIEGQPHGAGNEKNYLRVQPLVWPGWCAFPGHAMGFICEWNSAPTN